MGQYRVFVGWRQTKVHARALQLLRDVILDDSIKVKNIFQKVFKRSRKQMRQTGTISFSTKFVVKYWYAKHENRKCCPQHGALSAFSVGLAFSAVTIAVSEPLLLPTAEN